MDKLENLLQHATDNNIKIHSFNLGIDELRGLYVSGNIALSTKLETTREKTCVLAEELGHYHTTVGDILDLSKIDNLKQEYKARKWAWEYLLPVESILLAVSIGYKEVHSMAEYLDVDESFLRERLENLGLL
jgi:Predicted Zn peptidase